MAMAVTRARSPSIHERMICGAGSRFFTLRATSGHKLEVVWIKAQSEGVGSAAQKQVVEVAAELLTNGEAGLRADFSV